MGSQPSKVSFEQLPLFGVFKPTLMNMKFHRCIYFAESVCCNAGVVSLVIQSGFLDLYSVVAIQIPHSG